jgi:membrane associated rhomboid family serine protease
LRHIGDVPSLFGTREHPRDMATTPGPFVDDKHQPLLNLPPVVSWLLLAMAAIELLVTLDPRGLGAALFETFAFVPLRMSFAIAPQAALAALADSDALGSAPNAELMNALNAGRAVYLTPLTYAFLHGGWGHLAINGLTLAAFGAPVARKTGALRFLLFFAACAVAGAATHYFLYPLDTTPVVGASAAISGTTAAIVRFAFAPGARPGAQGAFDGRATASLAQLGGNRTALLFLAVWLGANFVLGTLPQGDGSQTVAWEAHVGGFLFGLLTFGAFDRRAAPA